MITSFLLNTSDSSYHITSCDIDRYAGIEKKEKDEEKRERREDGKEEEEVKLKTESEEEYYTKSHMTVGSQDIKQS